MALVQDSVLFLGAAVIAVPLMKRLGFGSVLGYLAAGLAIGPSFLNLVSDVEAILHFGEFGVVLLLFIIGLELQPKLLWSLRRPIFGLGSAQVAITSGAIAGVAYLAGYDLQTAVLVGLTLALSSTAFAVQIMAERGELATRHGRAAFSILLFQDLVVIPLLAIIPSLASDVPFGESQVATPTDWQAIITSILVVAGVVGGGRYVLRPLLKAAAQVEATEVFTAAALFVVLGMAALMELVGLSMALGAFLAGVLLADTEYRHRLEADIEPFKGLLLGLFFMAVGMSVDLGLLISMPLTVLAVAVGLMALKSSVLFILGRLARLKTTGSLSLAGVLPQGGEFAFVLFGAAVAAGAMPTDVQDFLILVVAVTMALTPVAVSLADRMNGYFKKPVTADAPEIPEEDAPRVIIAGFGRMGQIVGRILAMRKIRFVALDADGSRVQAARRFGNEAYFGEANRLLILRAAHADRAEILVITVDNPTRAEEIAQLARMHFPHLKIYARAYDRIQAYRMIDIGVDVVIRETFHSSVEVARAVFSGLGVPNGRSDQILKHFVSYDEALLREQYLNHRDEEAFIKSTRDAMDHLLGLFAQDAEAQEPLTKAEETRDTKAAAE